MWGECQVSEKCALQGRHSPKAEEAFSAWMQWEECACQYTLLRAGGWVAMVQFSDLGAVGVGSILGDNKTLLRLDISLNKVRLLFGC